MDQLSTGLSRQVQDNGYAFIQQWESTQSTRDLASVVGTIIELDPLLPTSAIPTIQKLQPRKESEALNSQYSGVFGLEEFPLHTDLAHWAMPPRYFMLRCIYGIPDVATRLLPTSAVMEAVGHSDLRRALVKPRRPSRYGNSGLLTLAFSSGQNLGLRWDSLFLTPMNTAARRVMDFMSAGERAWGELNELILHRPGDTLIVDNWRMLHGRSRVDAGAKRLIERVYLSEIIS